MGATDSTAICNIALRKLGDKKISSISDTNDVLAVKCNDVYSTLLKETLISAKPRFAVKPAILGHVTDSTTNITAISVSSGVITITAASHGLSTGNIISIVSVVGMVELNGLKFTITKVDNNSLTLDNIDGGSFTAYTSGGTVGLVSVVGSEVDFNNRYSLPSDFLTLWKLSGDEIKFYRPISSSDRSPLRDKTHSIEWGGSALELLTDDVVATIKYIYDATDTTKFDDLFVNMFAWQLAAELAFTITQSKSMANDVRDMAGVKLANFKTSDSHSSGTPRQARQNDIIDARN